MIYPRLLSNSELHDREDRVATRLEFILIWSALICVLAAGCRKTTKLTLGNDWVSIFDGSTLDGWRVNEENPASFRVQDGAIVAHGPRTHLFLDVDEPLTNFEFEAEVMTTPGSNSGIYFHTKYQPRDWPKYGYEAQVNATQSDWRKTGSLYGVDDVRDPRHRDGEWFKYHIRVEGKRITLTVNDEVRVDYTEPEDKKPERDRIRVLSEGTIALQAHDPESKVLYRNLRLRRLP